MFDMVTLGMVPSWVPLPKQRRFRKADVELRKLVNHLVADRLARGADGDDMVSRLIASTAAELDPAAGRRRMRDELVTILLAGHETTASTLSWTFYFLHRHPEVLARVRAEAAEVLGDRLPGHDDLRGLTYTASVVEEVMRLRPPVWMLPRQAVADDEVGGYRVPAGSDVLISPYTLHRNPAFWTDPERFDPDRFGSGGQAARPRYAYIPFGAGPRFCVGSHLGMMEATFVTAMVARDLSLELVPGYRAEPEPMLSLRVRGGLPMTVHAARPAQVEA
jgi:cytochrome P450